MNAMKHGLTSRILELLPDEERDEFIAFYDALWQDLQPVGAREERLAERIINGFWRIRRIERVEAGLYIKEIESIKDNNSDRSNAVKTARAFVRNSRYDLFTKLIRYETSIDRGLSTAMSKFDELQQRRLKKDLKEKDSDSQ